MKRLSTILLAVLICCLYATAQRTGVWDEVRADHRLASGLDNVYSFDVPALSKRPRGYREFYISHYGRHGSRYAYTAKTYNCLKNAMEAASLDDNLTEYGKFLKEELAPFFKTVEYRVGDLSPLGWQQQKRIAQVMVKSFPRAFRRGAVVDACVSPSMRSAMSMTSLCLSLGQLRPKMSIYEHQSIEDIQATRPNHGGHNPFAYNSIFPPSPCTEPIADYLERKLDLDAILGRIFKNPQKIDFGATRVWVADYLYMLVGGMHSLEGYVDIPDVSGIFTNEEYAAMWEVDNYLRYHEYYKYQGTCCSIYDDIIAKADARIASGKRGADLRFGHDHVMMALLMIADINDFGHPVDNADDLALWFQTFESKMGTNLQLVFYKPCRKGKPILVKLLFNGVEARFSGLEPVNGPYYAWEDLKEFLNSRTALFCDRPSR